jgi:hypothetical protein
MKIKILLFIIILCVTGTSALAVRGDTPGKLGSTAPWHQGGQKYKGAGVFIDVPGTLLFGNRYVHPPPGTVVYGLPYPDHRSGTDAGQPGICFEERTVYGDGGQIGRENGRRFWTSYPYSVIQRVQVPCQ